MRPFDPRVLRLVPAARQPLAALAALGVGAGLAAIAAALAVAGLALAIAEPGRDLPAAALLAAVAFAARAACLGASEIVAAHAAGVVSSGLRSALAAELLRRRAEDLPDADRAATLLTQGAAGVEPYVSRYLPTLVAAAFLPPAVIVTMAVLDPVTALVPVLTVPLLPLFAALIGSSTGEATRRRWRTLAALSGHFLDVMRGLPALVSYGRAGRQAGVVREVSERHRRATVETLRLAFLSSAALELLATISVAMVAVWVGIHLAQGDMALAVALPLILLAPEAYWPIRRVGAEFHAAADGAQALADIADELERPILTGTDPTGTVATGTDSTGTDPTGTDPTGTEGAGAEGAGAASVDAGLGAPQVVLRGLGYRYGPELPWVLHRLDARFGGLTHLVDAARPGGRLVVVTGPSGAGKTTLLELIAGLRTPTAGAVERTGRAHLVTQRPFLVAGSLRDNLLLRAGQDATDEDLLAAVRRVGLDELLDGADGGSGQSRDTTCRGLDLRLGDDGFGLSAGQRARLALAGALLSDADIVLLDEPTAHLDPLAEALAHDVIRDLARTRLVIAVSHRPALAALADERLEVPAALSRAAR